MQPNPKADEEKAFAWNTLTEIVEPKKKDILENGSSLEKRSHKWLCHADKKMLPLFWLLLFLSVYFYQPPDLLNSYWKQCSLSLTCGHLQQMLPANDARHEKTDLKVFDWLRQVQATFVTRVYFKEA